MRVGSGLDVVVGVEGLQAKLCCGAVSRSQPEEGDSPLPLDCAL